MLSAWKRNTKRWAFASLAVCSLSFSSLVRAEDWPEWMGTGRQGEIRESGLVKSIPAGGLKVLWRVPIHGGYAGPAVAKGRVYVSDYDLKAGKNTNNPGGRDELDGIERILCLDAATGKQLWAHEYDRHYFLSYGSGPRATPTVDGDKVYALGAEGDLICLESSNGKVVWQKNLATTYKSESPIWGHSASPLVYGNLLICLAGGEGSVVVALDKQTGKEVWRALSASEIGYCAPTIFKHSSGDQLIIWHAEALNALEPKTGKVIWTAPLKPSYGMSIAAPRIVDNKMYASGIGEVGAMFEIAADGKSVSELWRGKGRTNALYSANAGPLFDGKSLYGADCGSGAFVGVNAADGKRYWETFEPTAGGTRRASHGTAFVVKYDDVAYLFSETGDFIIALTPESTTRSAAFSCPRTRRRCVRSAGRVEPSGLRKQTSLRSQR
ncbi:MAG: PQQ-binding-like beta-propeller repeat protein [Pirellulales bacterium]